MKKRYLILEDGTIFQGWGFGADETVIGELVFTTNMVGYVETLTDPSYYGQIILQTFPLIGNYGIIEEDFEGTPRLFGYVVKEWCPTPSNFRCGCTVDEFLKKHHIPGLWGVDTREITTRIREYGVVNAMISDTIPEDWSDIAAYSVRDAVAHATCAAPTEYPALGEEKHHVVLLDYGAKGNIIRSLQKRGCRVTAVPASTSAEDILALNPDGIMLSNGPGDPAENVGPIAELKKLLGKKPIFGICLGHQLLALAAGGQTVKLKYGHRGGNHPVKDLAEDRVFITSQNHGYVVLSETVDPAVAEVSHVNVNDGTCEGLRYKRPNCFTTQFHPEASPGPKDTEYLFDRFVASMGGDR